MKAVVYACMANGLEEVECLAAVDVMRRCGIEVKLVSMSGELLITGSLVIQQVLAVSRVSQPVKFLHGITSPPSSLYGGLVILP